MKLTDLTALFALAYISLWSWPSAAQSTQTFLTQAWAAKDAADNSNNQLEIARHQGVVALNAKRCIGRGLDAALAFQHDLTAKKEPAPLIGPADPNSDRAKAIFARGELNDVGACRFLLAESLASENKCDDAKREMVKLLALTYARVWNIAKKEFWAPADTARNWLNENKENKDGHCEL